MVPSVGQAPPAIPVARSTPPGVIAQRKITRRPRQAEPALSGFAGVGLHRGEVGRRKIAAGPVGRIDAAIDPPLKARRAPFVRATNVFMLDRVEVQIIEVGLPYATEREFAKLDLTSVPVKTYPRQSSNGWRASSAVVAYVMVPLSAPTC